MKLDTWEKRLLSLAGGTKIGCAFFLRKGMVFFYDIMIAVDHIKSFFVIKRREFTEDIAVDFLDLFHVPVFPEFITIAQFNISVALLIIMTECGKIQTLVF